MRGLKRLIENQKLDMFSITRYFDPCFVNTIEKDETYHGHWWLPEKPDNKVSGVLRLLKKGGIHLNLIGMFLNDASEILRASLC